MKKENIVKSRTEPIFSDLHEYSVFLHDIKNQIIESKVQASKSVNRTFVGLYMFIGKMIVEKQQELGWGNSVVEILSKDLKREFPYVTGFSPQNLWLSRQFYLEYCDFPNLQQLVGEIPWGHNVLIMQKIKDDNERKYYLESTENFGWTRNVLLNQIKANAYNNSKIEKHHNFGKTLPSHLVEQADEMLKSKINLEFLGLSQLVREFELEKRLLSKLKDFLIELGYGFCFIGSQYRITLGEKEYFIDLLFYHRFLKSLIAIELKTGAFKPEYAGKMDFYLEVLNDTEKANDDNPSIGIILCAEKDKLEVEISLRSKANPIGVATYQLYPQLPDEYKGKLPTSEEWQWLLETSKKEE
ncbi:MAG: PDDEXK nuclease domain-containing protein [Candidatus Kapabacteria bacterium]|nr:PDDEXK nuclease domain-containing protein [Candidatus Kapabacteria bacterium]